MVPGTNIQITFQIWLDAALLTMAILALALLYHLNRPVINNFVIRYAPIHANQVHQRLMIANRQKRFNLRQSVRAIGRTVVTLPAGIAGLL